MLLKLKQFIKRCFRKIVPRSPYQNKKALVGAILLGIVAGVALGSLVYGLIKGFGPLLDKVIEILTGLILLFISLFGRLIGVGIAILIGVAQYNDFLHSDMVNTGWTIIRDICNMFLVIILLVIAFCTVLKIEQYSYKKLLGQLILAAIIVNFSKLICGIIIDFSQVVMLTFINGIRDVATGNFANILGLKEMMSIVNNPSGAVSPAQLKMPTVFLAALLALILTLVAVIVIFVMAIILILRIVVLWILIVLSPFAFILHLLPKTATYAHQWWEKFTNQVVVGPAMAFFLWLALSISTTSLTQEIEQLKSNSIIPPDATFIGATVGVMGQAPYLMGFIFGIVTLLTCLTAVQKLGAAGASMAGKAAGKITNTMQGAARLPFRGVKAAGLGMGRSVGERFFAATGIPILPSQIKREYQTAQQKRRWRRESEGKMKRSSLASQWEERGWVAGTTGYLDNVLGVGKAKTKKGAAKIAEARKTEGEYTSQTQFDATVKERDAKQKAREEHFMFRSADPARAGEMRQFLANSVSPYITTWGTKRYNSSVADEKQTLTSLIGFAEEKEQQYIASGDTAKAKQIRSEIDQIKAQMAKGGVVDIQKFGEVGKVHQGFNDRANQLNSERFLAEGMLASNGFVDLEDSRFAGLKDLYGQTHGDWAKGGDALTKALAELNATLTKYSGKVMSDADWKKKVTDPLQRGAEMVVAGRRITEPKGSYEQRAIEAQLMREKQKELPPSEIYDQQEFIALAREAVEEGDWLKYRAVLTRLVEEGDINEPILHDEKVKREGKDAIDKKYAAVQFDTATPQGWDQWAHYIGEKMHVPYEDVQKALNEWGNMAMQLGQTRMSSPYVYDLKSKDLRLKNQSEFEADYLYRSGQMDAEKRTRGVGKMGVYGEEIGPDGVRHPIHDELALQEALNNWKSWSKEAKTRFNKDRLYITGSPTGIQFLVTRVLPRAAGTLTTGEMDEFITMIKELKDRWQGMGRSDPGGRIAVAPGASLAGRLNPEQISKLKSLGVDLTGII